ncbi:efflux transporter periplasmic adaptor subunit [Phyllobacterium phragmitis]|uniref:Efflux transporter periplasmic adaptor subunit n=1 Tax=Phyllobacterium phragmitis TaxID=2670329 RepID=A0A2S9IMK8_9HYPH|nr:efflux RND transporter periplasmic adaptor subunit [Phyllobacterium phragmitis]PRD41764.1 efflux transporter periplasmic adaptor subunit [Phyllobacterium phragmitis]
MKPIHMRGKRRFRWRLWLALLGVLLIAAYLGFRHWTREEPLPPLSTVQRGNVESSVLATGTLKPQHLVAVGAQATGRILSLKVRPGQNVRKGEVVALIDSTTQENDLRKFRAQLREQEATRDQHLAELELAKQELARNQLMITSNAVSKAAYNQAANKVKTVEAQVAYSEASIAAAQIDVQIAEANLAYTRITAPIDGTVLATVVQEGQTVNAQQSAPMIAILGQLDTMVVEADISEADVTQVHEGLPLYFTISGQSGKRYEGKLEKIDPAPDTIVNDKSFNVANSTPSSGTTASAVYYKGIFSVPNPDRLLRTYMTAEVHILLASAKDVLLVPVSALKPSGTPDKATVRVVASDGTISERTVETGISDKIMTEIRSGLQEGDKVVTDNQPPAKPGTEAAVAI